MMPMLRKTFSRLTSACLTSSQKPLPIFLASVFTLGVLLLLYPLTLTGLKTASLQQLTVNKNNSTSAYNQAWSKTSSSSHKQNEKSYATFRERNRARYDSFSVDLERDNIRHGEKYFIYRCDDTRMSHCGGWADRLKGIMAGYVIANVTGRTFKAEIKTHGCDLLDYIVPNRLNWTLPVSFHQNVIEDHDVFVMDKNYNRTFYKDVQNIDFISSLVNKPKFVYFKGNFDYMDGFKASKFHHDQLSWMTNLSRDRVNSAIYRHLFRLSPRLQQRLDEFLNTSLASPSDKLICAHVRIGANPSIPADCVNRNSLDVLPKVWKFIESHINKTPQNHKAFIMSDSQKVMEEAKHQNFNRSLILIPGRIAHIEMTTTMTDTDLCKAQEKVVLEHYLLMSCDVLMISNSGLSRLPAYVRGSNKDLYCLINENIVPCKPDSLKELYNVMG